jgi:guanyl-specific ribonuclease Sa
VNLRRLLVALLAVLAAVFGPVTGTTSVGAASFTYDAPAVARVDVREFEAAGASPAQLSGSQDGSASPPAAAQGASTTPLARSHATNTAKGLGDDFTRALDDIDNGLPRPNVRNPKSFGNDGRGGTTRLPDVDGAGNPVNYVEHTVNPRPPGGSLDGSRIVVGSDGSVWATTDHFVTWTQVR